MFSTTSQSTIEILRSLSSRLPDQVVPILAPPYLQGIHSVNEMKWNQAHSLRRIPSCRQWSG